MAAHEGGDAGAALGKLVSNDGGIHDAAATAAVLLGDIGAHKSGRSYLPVEVPVKSVVVHPPVSGLDLVLSKLPGHVAEHLLLLSELDKHIFSSLTVI